MRRAGLAARRQASGLTQEQLAERLGVERSTVARWESGHSTPRPWARPRLADALGLTSGEVAALVDAALDGDPASQEFPTATDSEVDTNRRQLLTAVAGASLVAGVMPPPRSSAYSTTTSWATPVREAVLDPLGLQRLRHRTSSAVEGRRRPHRAAPLVDLRRRVVGMTAASLASNHALLTRHLPSLINDTELAAASVVTDDDALLACRLVSDTYAGAAWTLIKGGHPDVAAIAAGRAISAAEDASDPVRLAAGVRALAETSMREGDHAQALHLALTASLHLDRPLHMPNTQDRSAWCVHGAALLSGAAAAARQGDARTARAALAAAAAAADRLGDDVVALGTVFGPTNVRIHHVAVAIELGDAAGAVAAARAVDETRLPFVLAERRARHLIDVARAHAATGDDTAALTALLQAERDGPDETRTHRHTHAVLRTLMLHEKRSTGLRELAGRCHLVA